MRKFIFTSVFIVNLLSGFICFKIYGSGTKNNEIDSRHLSATHNSDSNSMVAHIDYDNIISHIQASEGELIGNYMKWTSILVEVFTVLLTVIILLNELKHAKAIETLKDDLRNLETKLTDKHMALTLSLRTDYEALVEKSAQEFSKFSLEFVNYKTEFEKIIDDVKKEASAYKKLTGQIEKERKYTSESSIKTFSSLLFFANKFQDREVLIYFNRQRFLSNLHSSDEKVRFSAICFFSAQGILDDVVALEKVALDKDETPGNQKTALKAIRKIYERAEK